MNNLIEKAKQFATKAHSLSNQKRKYTEEPYIVHPERVSYLVSLVTQDENMIAAAWLHDVVEDTTYTFDDISEEFGIKVACLVDELTDKYSDPCHGNREERKNKERERWKRCSFEAKTIKVADFIDNSLSICEYDPNFAKVYLNEKRKMLIGPLLSANIYLWNIANNILLKEVENLESIKISKGEPDEN